MQIDIKVFEKLKSLKSTELLVKHDNGRALYKVKLTSSWKQKNMVGEFPFKRMPRHPLYEIRTMEEITGHQSDEGYILIDNSERV